MTTNNFCELSTDFHFHEFFKGSKAKQVYVDVGAYDGDTIKLALDQNSKLKVVAIEPVQELITKIKKDNPNAIVINAAASDHQGTVRLYQYPPPYQGCSTLEEYMTKAHNAFLPPRKVVNVHCARLDTLLKEHKIDTVDYLKIDTEGHEEEVLAGFTLYHPGTRFHIEYHINNLANLLYCLKDKKIDPFKITLAKDAVKRDVTVGYILAEAQ